MNALDSSKQTGSLTTVVLVSAVGTLLNAVAVCGGGEAGVIGAEEAITLSSLCNDRITWSSIAR